ncbi:hypothetical protein D3C74_177830 [compost metagenome]
MTLNQTLFEGMNSYMKIRREFLALLLIGVMLFGLTACGGNNKVDKIPTNPPSESTESAEPTETPEVPAESVYKTPTEDSSKWQAYTKEQYFAENTEGKEIAYQFVQDSILEPTQGVGIVVKMNMYTDGFLKVTQTNNRGGTFYYYGYWTNQNDENLFFGVTSYSLEDEVVGMDYAYQTTLDNGQFAFSFNASLGFAEGGQYVRALDIGGDGSVQYETEEAFSEYASGVIKKWGADLSSK